MHIPTLLPILTVLIPTLAAPTPPQVFLSAQSKFTSLPNFFIQSLSTTDPALLPPAPPRLGLLDEWTWESVRARVGAIARERGRKVKIVVLQRHGQGTHNAAESKYGTPAWNDYYSKLPLYFDAPLTPLGVHQLSVTRSTLRRELSLGLSVSRVYSSPLSRCLNTTQLVWADTGVVPRVVEELRETYGVHTCDARRSRTELAALYPAFEFSGLVGEEDPWWTPDKRETEEETRARVLKALEQIFDEEEDGNAVEDGVVSIVCHGGVIESVLDVTGHRAFNVPPSGLIPLVIVDSRARKGEML
ncbi:hypothetical protein PhCBS80983_g06037 [Powellomyces hirtus]|uniref:Uncharacterized protein n=1 Tax=Powellomyces hirtus TaxID=109895 RepID=A0A507DR19_9FUNG|nr:hypothetical protein PhCBS80983_g06037 [Powellomyces hirtus]